MPFPNFLLRWHKPNFRSQAKLLVVVEGRHDVAFLRTLSRILRSADASIPDLGMLESAGELVFLPFGGGDVLAWAERLAAIGLSELHIYDRETAPETELRQRAATLVNQRPHCRAFVTQKRSLENYLHPSCIREISGLALAYGEDDEVAELVARSCHERLGEAPEWESLPGRARKRFRERAKNWLNRLAVEQRTPELLAEQDPHGEVRSWILAAGEMLGGEPGGNHAS